MAEDRTEYVYTKAPNTDEADVVDGDAAGKNFNCCY